ncbi:MAG: hypothetical protein R6U40_14495 [Desulfobacterales bacterium]
MEKISPERGMKDKRGLENISNLFLSTGHKAKENFHQAEDEYDAQGRYELEETVTVCKKLAFHDDENVQQNMIKTLSRHIEEGYHIKRVDLQKNEDISKSGGRTRREEEVVIFIKAPVST